MEGKFKSGRFWMAMISAMVFAYVSMNQMIEGKDTLIIITMVFSYYFGRSDGNGDPKPPVVP